MFCRQMSCGCGLLMLRVVKSKRARMMDLSGMKMGVNRLSMRMVVSLRRRRS